MGEYGRGKTCLLELFHRKLFPERRIKSFYFDNPGVQFYDLANALLRAIGRKDLAKSIWELAGPHISIPYQGSLFGQDFEEYLSLSNRPRQQQDITGPLQKAVKNAGVASDDQIAHCIARIVTDAGRKPYFEYRDFIPRKSGSIVAEGEEAPYFAAILKIISKSSGADGIAFLIDEFEEIGLQKRLTKRAAHGYLATLKRLINLSQNEDSNFWLVLSMTPDAYYTTRELEPSLDERLGNPIDVNPLTGEDALALVSARIDAARVEGSSFTGSLFPFPEALPFDPTTFSNPRRLIKACFFALADADESVMLPFTDDYLRRIESTPYSLDDGDKHPQS